MRIYFVQQVGVALVYLASVLVQGEEIDETCGSTPRFPSRSTMKQLLSKWRWEDGDDQTYFLEYSALLTLYANTTERVNVTRLKPAITALNGDRKCPRYVRQLTKEVGATMRQRSSCPWYYELNFDRYRFPSTIVTAMCKCHGRCVGVKRRHARCEPIEIQQKVLRVKTDSNGKLACENKTKYKMLRSVENVSIGCTCVYYPEDKKPNTPRHKIPPA